MTWLVAALIVVVIGLIALYFFSPWFREHVRGWTVSALSALAAVVVAFLKAKGLV